MATRSGLDAQFGFVAESTYGTVATPTRFLEFDSEDLKLAQTFLEGEGLRAGRKYKRVSRVGVSRKSVTGKVELKVPNIGMGLLLKHMIGSTATATQILTTGAYKQIHQPGDHYGLSTTIQVGRPEPGTGTVRAHSFLGCKCTQWELSVSDGEHLMLSTTWDGRTEDTATALAAASYASGAELFNFSHATLKLGGTSATTSGEVAITGGTAVSTIVNSMTIRGENPMATERYGLGNAGLKAQQLENDYPTVTGSLDAEFSKTELYDVYTSVENPAMELAFTFGDAGGSNAFEFRFVAPEIILKDAAPQVDGPGLVRMSTEFEIYDDETNAPFQITYVSTDTAI